MAFRRARRAKCALVLSGVLAAGLLSAGTAYAEEEALAQSWRFTDGIPDNVLYEAQEESGIELYGAYSDVPDSYRSTWSKSDGVSAYSYRVKPTDSFQEIKVPDVVGLGVDVSYFNNEKGGVYKPIDWSKAKADGVSFAIVRIGDGGSAGKFFSDPWFARNIQGAKAAGIKVGAYVYSRALYLEGSKFSVANEVNGTLAQLKAAGISPKDLDFPIYLDMEDSSQKKLGKAMIAKIATAYCDAIQDAGYKVGIYANQDWFNNVLTDGAFSPASMKKSGWSRWVARYSWGSTASGVQNTDLWQFTSIGIVSGMQRKYCDTNFAYMKDASGVVAKRVTWKYTGSKWYLVDSAGSNLTGWQMVKGKQYYLRSDGSMQTNWGKIDGKWYYFGSDGAKQTGWIELSSGWYYLDSNGAMKTGWQKLGAYWYYLDPSSGVMLKGWQEIGGYKYYLSTSSGIMLTGTQTIDGKTYQFAGSGELISEDHGSSTVSSGWVWEDNHWYYRDGSGKNLIGWQKVGKTWYYMSPNGEMQTGWQYISGKWYYLKSSGAMATGWNYISGKWYYLKGSGAMATGWNYISGKWYYLKSSGAMAEGWSKVGETWYYLNPGSGAMATGWKKISGTWYYLAKSGAMASSKWVGNYYVTASGAMATNTWIGAYHVNASGLWDATR